MIGNNLAKGRILYLPFDHLHRKHGVLKHVQKEDVILLVESERMADASKFHPVRLYFLISSARHFAEELRAEGLTVEYIKAPTTLDGIAEAKKKHGIETVSFIN